MRGYIEGGGTWKQGVHGRRGYMEGGGILSTPIENGRVLYLKNCMSTPGIQFHD